MSSLIPTRQIILIRHAESEENVAEVKSLKVVKKLYMLKLPRLVDILYALHFVYLNLFPNDPWLSLLGKRQVKDISIQLQEDSYLEQFSPDVFISSTLDRAKTTLRGIIPNVLDDIPCIYRDDLKEASWWEALMPQQFLKKINTFEQWLQNTNYKRIVIVGHSQYFKHMLKSKEYMRNCDVWEVSYDFNDKEKQWTWCDMTMKYRSTLSQPHPLNRFFDQDFDQDDVDVTLNSSMLQVRHRENTTNKVDDNRHEDTGTTAEDDDDTMITCRICQMNKLECPSLPLIRPCKCNGSLAYVHISCLNQWRSTSTTAQTMCSVCHFRYQTKQAPKMSVFLKDQRIIMLATVIGSMFAIWSTGLIIITFSIYLGPKISIPQMCSNFIGLNRFWLYCGDMLRHLNTFSDEYKSEDYVLLALNKWMLSICQPSATLSFDCLLVGHTIISSITFIYTLYVNIPRLWNARRDEQDFQQLMSLFALFAVHMNGSVQQVTIYGILAWHGFASFVRGFYRVLDERVRNYLSQLEEVIEYNTSQ